MATQLSEPESIARGVVDTLLGRVFDGTYAVGARLPSERDLATELGVARVSVREALGVLGGYHLIETVRGSGAVVTPRRRWTSDALAAAMASGLRLGQWDALARLIEDALELRRTLVLDMLERAAPHLGPGSLTAARAALAQGGDAAFDRAEFLRRDREIIPLILEAAEMFPSLWLLNSMAGPYLEVMARIGGSASADPKYRAAHLETFDALEASDGPAARARFSRHLDTTDRLLIRSLPVELSSRVLRNKKRKSK